MASRTPRKRKHSSAASDGRQSAFGTPTKKLLVDYDVVSSPLTTRSCNLSSSAKRSPLCGFTDTEDLMDKENFVPSPRKSRTARKLLISPTQVTTCDASPKSEFKAAVPAISFYKKDSVYVTPLDRKIINQSRLSSSRSDESSFCSPDKPKRSPEVRDAYGFPQAKKPPSKRKPNPKRGKVPSSAGRKTAANTPPAKPAPVPEDGIKSGVLGLKMKQRPKLTVGAAFFATSRKPHSAPKKPAANIKFPPSAKAAVRPARQPNALTALCEKVSSSAGKVQGDGVGVESQSRGLPGTKSLSEDQTRADLNKGLKEATEKTSELSVSQPSQRLAPQADSPKQGAAGAPPGVPRSSSPFDVDEPILEAADKKASTIYPIFSTPGAGKKRAFDLRGELSSPVCSSTPSATPITLNKLHKQSKRKKEAGKEADDQLIIDAGQKHFGPVACSTCGMVYSAASLEDEAQHVQYHRRLLEGIRYVGWKKERVVAEFWDGKILLITSGDPKYALKKAEEVRELVDSELGFQQISLSSPSQTKSYLFVSNEKKIVGCVIAEPVKQAYRVLTEPPSPESAKRGVLDRHRAWTCSTTPEPAVCGISRVWVFALMRRKGIAKRLLDAVRTSFIYGSHITAEEIAFSDPTPDGKLFAGSYCGAPDFLVYNFVS
ncbi:N-acetyltransferase ESCO2 [Spea bombifrons]|uniref:N-acetyltransferase ESCO2 n=1 Tax=Spea bombifrons TaxID=233779 RepID=UPI00234AFCBB|nr:N-acetyltransferase ESCO2 [Spea bombifrons]